MDRNLEILIGFFLEKTKSFARIFFLKAIEFATNYKNENFCTKKKGTPIALYFYQFHKIRNVNILK
jgi:hypothetical protein